jgi:hypothetical protein
MISPFEILRKNIFNPMVHSKEWFYLDDDDDNDNNDNLATCAPNGHLQRLAIPDAVLIQFNLLMMSMLLLETCRGI